MRVALGVLSSLLMALPAVAEPEAEREVAVAAEIEAAWRAYDEAAGRRDRAALERLFHEDWVWVHANGSVVDRATHIANILANEWTAAPVPRMERLVVLGDMAMLRGPQERGIYSTTVLVRREGGWQFVHAQTTRLPPERTPVPIDPATLDRFVGRYQFGPGAVAEVTREGDTLMWKGGRRARVRLLPLGEARFFAEGTDSEMVFQVAEGRVTGVVLRLGAIQESQAARVP